MYLLNTKSNADYLSQNSTLFLFLNQSLVTGQWYKATRLRYQEAYVVYMHDYTNTKMTVWCYVSTLIYIGIQHECWDEIKTKRQKN